LFLSVAPPPPHISPLSLHDALPISCVPSRDSTPAWTWGNGTSRSSTSSLLRSVPRRSRGFRASTCAGRESSSAWPRTSCASGKRSEEHTSELQSRENLVCRLLLEKK